MNTQQDLFGRPKPLTLVVRGNVPSFKNSKMLIAKDRHGNHLPRPLLITKPELQKRMEEITESLKLQLLSAFQTAEGKTLTGCSLRCSIAFAVPADDCWTQIPKLNLSAELCETPDGEGATIVIQRIG